MLHLLKTSTGGSWALRQMRELVKLGVDVHVALPAGGPLIPEYVASGVCVHLGQFDFPVKDPWRFPEVARRLRGLVGDTEPDLIHSHFVGTTLTMRLGLGRSHSTPRVFQVPGPLHLEHAAFRRMELATSGPADSWIGSCRWTVDRYIRSGVPSSRVFLSYYGTDVTRFDDLDRGRLRRELGLGADTPLVGMVAFMYRPKRYLGQRRGLKGHEDLIDAVALCRGRGSRLRCVFVGGAWGGAVDYENRVRAYAAARCPEGVVFLGTRDDAVDLLAGLDVIAVPSHSENVGGAVEALLARVPTVATAVGGLPDLVEDGDTGWLVPPRNPVRLAEAIMEALSNPGLARDRAARGRERASALFDCRTTAREILNIYGVVQAAAGERSGP